MKNNFKNIVEKICVMIVAMAFSLCFAACEKPQELSELDKIGQLLENFRLENTNGFDYSMVQKVGEVVVNSNVTQQRIERGEKIKAYTETTSTRLSEFVKEQQFIETNSVTYFNDGKLGLVENGVVVWQNTTSEKYFLCGINKIKLGKLDAQTVKISLIDNIITLTAPISSDEIKNIFGANLDGATNITLLAKTDFQFKKLDIIKINYAQKQSVTEITFSPFYAPAQVVLPQ